MAQSTEVNKTTVKTRIPAYQKEIWKAEAEELEMSQSEYVRTMVQAGRRTFDQTEPEGDFSDATPGGRALERRILDLLAEAPMDWDALVEACTADVEDELEEAIMDLQDRGAIEHRPRGAFVRQVTASDE